jgi:hypothetical protein
VLIHLDPSLIHDAAETTTSAAKSRVVIERALLAHGYGKHLLSFQRSDYKRLQAMRELFSERAKVALQDAHQRLDDTLGQKKDLSWYLLLGLGTRFENRAACENGQFVLHADAHAFEDPERLGRTILLGENRTDARLYHALAKAFSAFKGWRQRLGFQLDGGGGSTIDGEFEERCKDGRIVFAIADSDRRYPAAQEKSTAKNLRKALQNRPAYQHGEVLDVRAAENLLPLRIYEEALARDSEQSSKLRSFNELCTMLPAHMHAWWRHIDLKAGVIDNKLAQKSDENERAYWTEVLDRAERERIDGLGSHCLEHVVDWMEREWNGRRIANLLALATDASLNDLAGRLAAWGVACPGTRP